MYLADLWRSANLYSKHVARQQERDGENCDGGAEKTITLVPPATSRRAVLEAGNCPSPFAVTEPSE
jgi:hypothetical protein